MASRQIRYILAPALALLATLSASALTVAVAPAEEPNPPPGFEGEASPMAFFVSGCMGGLFDAGQIATDTRASRVARSAWGAPDYALDQAREGLVECVVAVFVEWKVSSFHKGVEIPALADYRLVRPSDGLVLAEGRVDGPEDSEETAARFETAASDLGGEVAAACMERIRSLTMGGNL